MIGQALISYLKLNKLTISTVESCTGGHLINKITNIEGASAVTSGGIVTYSNAQKIKAGVPATIIEKYGVYSKECAEAMATVALDMFSSNIGIGITGTLSNIDKNNKDSKKGEVFYCIRINALDRVIKLTRTILVPIQDRDLQKEFIVNIIITKLTEVIESEIIKKGVKSN